jgi:hypothetical protein
MKSRSQGAGRISVDGLKSLRIRRDKTSLPSDERDRLTDDGFAARNAAAGKPGERRAERIVATGIGFQALFGSSRLGKNQMKTRMYRAAMPTRI